MGVDPIIHEEVIREMKHLTSFRELDKGKSSFLNLLSDIDKKNRVFKSCLSLLDDAAHRRSAAMLLLFYLTDLSCTTSMLEVLHIKLSEVLEISSADQFQLLYLLRRTVEQVLPLWCGVSSSKNVSEAFAVVDPIFQLEDIENSETIVPILLPSEKESIEAAQHRNDNLVFQRKRDPFFLTPRISIRSSGITSSHSNPSKDLEDYIYQCPLRYNKEGVERHLRVVSQLWDRYRINPSVVRSSGFLIKIICDSYVSKLPLGEPYLFRSISMCVLPMLFEWMEAEYLCTRHHVFNFLVTLSVHLQVVDSQNLYPGVTKKLEKELFWLLQRVLQRQVLVVPYDELTLIAAAKCILVILPRSERSGIDPRLLFQILNISGMSELHPETFSLFCEAFVLSLLQFRKPKGKKERRREKEHKAQKMVVQLSNTFNERKLSALGNTAFSSILGLYCRANSVVARIWLFKLIFVFAARRLQQTDSVENQKEFEVALQISLGRFLSYGFFWSWHAQLFYINPRIRAEVTTVFSLPPDSTDTGFSSYTRCIYAKLLNTFLSMAEENGALPENLVHQFVEHHARSSAMTEEGITKAVEDGLITARLLLKSECSSSGYDQYNTAWRLLLYVIDLICAAGTEGNVLLDRFIQVMIVCHEDDLADGNRIRRIIPDILVSQFIRWKQISHGSANKNVLERELKKSFNLIAEAYLQNSTRPVCHRFAALYHNVLENIVEFECSPYHSNSPESSDLTSLLLDRFAIIEADRLEMLGIQFFWFLYKGLVSYQTVSICRTRQVLASFLYYLTTKFMSLGFVWKCMLDDIYPPVSLIAGKRVGEICRKLKNPAFKRDDDFAAVWRSLCMYAKTVVPASSLGVD